MEISKVYPVILKNKMTVTLTKTNFKPECCVNMKPDETGNNHLPSFFEFQFEFDPKLAYCRIL